MTTDRLVRGSNYFQLTIIIIDHIGGKKQEGAGCKHITRALPAGTLLRVYYARICGTLTYALFCIASASCRCAV